MAEIKTVTADDLRQMEDQEGLVLQGCGGDLQEWVDGINDLFTEAGIPQSGNRFGRVSVFQQDGLTNLLFPFDGVQLDVGKLAIWRLQTHAQFGGTWLSDYVPNRLGGFVQEQRPQRPKMELLGQDGNIFAILGRDSALLKRAGMKDQADEMFQRVTASGSYEQALNIISEYVETELTSPPIHQRSNKKRGMPMSDKWEIIQGDALKVLEGFAPGTFDAVITDPPYASGGRTQAEKNKSTTSKYSSMGENAPPPFEGDAKDQRSWTRWAAEWLYEARKLCKPGAPVCMFIDWRQLPAAADALQWAGWIWRGTAVWDKGNSRPQKGRFRQQAEYIVWGSNGDMPLSRPVPCLPGVFKYGNPQNRIHLTEKPLQLMRDVVKIVEPGGHILDPFAGSGTTVLAAVLEGYTATGIEVTDEYARRARERIAKEVGVYKDLSGVAS